MNVILATLTTMWVEPERLWLLVLVPILPVLLGWAQWRRQRSLARLGNLGILGQLTSNVSAGFRWFRTLLLTCAVAWAVIAAARPQWGSVTQIVETKGIDLVILLDTSLSMLAEDIAPNRLTAAKHEVSQFLNRLTGDRVALVPFAGSAFVQCPLTVDYSAIRMFLREINIGTVQDEGTDLARAIETGLGAFIEDADGRNRAMIVFTDGESHDTQAALRAASKAAENSVRIHTVGIGSLDGDLIPIRRNGRADYLRDYQGNVVKTRLDDATLRRVAAETHGGFFRASIAGGELQEILDDINELERARVAEEQLITRVDRYQWPLGVAVICLLIIPFIPERRRTGVRG